MFSFLKVTLIVFALSETNGNKPSYEVFPRACDKINVALLFFQRCTEFLIPGNK